MKGYIGVDAALVRATWGVLGRCAAKWGTPWSDGRVPLADRSAPVVDIRLPRREITALMDYMAFYAFSWGG